MDEQKCRELIKKDVQEMIALCTRLINEIDVIDLNDVDWQLARIARQYDTAKMRLHDCEDF